MQGPKWPLFYSHIDPVWSLLIIGTGCTLGRAPRTKETLLDFRKWCRVTRHPRVFYGLTSCQRTPQFWGVTPTDCNYLFSFHILNLNMNEWVPVKGRMEVVPSNSVSMGSWYRSGTKI